MLGVKNISITSGKGETAHGTSNFISCLTCTSSEHTWTVTVTWAHDHFAFFLLPSPLLHPHFLLLRLEIPNLPHPAVVRTTKQPHLRWSGGVSHPYLGILGFPR